jgi:dedicator of cytokinesis protein 3
MDSDVVPGRNRAASLPWLAMAGSMSSCVTSGPKSAHDLLDPKAILDLEAKIPDFVLRYFKASETNTFISSKNIRRKVHESLSGLAAEQVECLSLSSEFTVSYTKERFPHLANRSEIIGTHSFEMEPIEYAIMAIAKKTKELSALSTKFASPRAIRKSDAHPAWSRDSFDSEAKRNSDIQPNTSPFTMALNGAVDAPVNGGIPLYKSVFLNSKFVALLKEEGKDNLLNSFQVAIDEQVTCRFNVCCESYH